MTFFLTIITLTRFKSGTVFTNNRGHTKSQSFHFSYTQAHL